MGVGNASMSSMSYVGAATARGPDDGAEGGGDASSSSVASHTLSTNPIGGHRHLRLSSSNPRREIAQHRASGHDDDGRDIPDGRTGGGGGLHETLGLEMGDIRHLDLDHRAASAPDPSTSAHPTGGGGGGVFDSVLQPVRVMFRRASGDSAASGGSRRARTRRQRKASLKGHRHDEGGPSEHADDSERSDRPGFLLSKDAGVAPGMATHREGGAGVVPRLKDGGGTAGGGGGRTALHLSLAPTMFHHHNRGGAAAATGGGAAPGAPDPFGVPGSVGGAHGFEVPFASEPPPLPPPPPPPTSATSARHHRRYQVGDRVLVCNHQSRWANLVNKFGFPDGMGDTPEEQRGPYVYVLSTVKRVHFEENAQYYTVQRADTGADQRADAEWMEPIRTAKGEAAALRAATESAAAPFGHPGGKGEKRRAFGYDADSARSFGRQCLDHTLVVFFSPFLVCFQCLDRTVGNCTRLCWRWTSRTTRGQATKFLNGLKPYSCSMRITGVNFLVACSTWYMFLDQIRLAFLPPASDYAVAVVSCVVWFVLVFEILFEVFIRPDGYFRMLESEKAFAPATVRHINRFHVLMEGMALLFYIPELICIVNPQRYDCGDRPGFSLVNSCIMAVLGPEQVNAFYGRAFMALLRLRIFGLVRHWKQMWIMSTIADPSFSHGRTNVLKGVFIPNSRAVSKQRKQKEEKEKAVMIGSSFIGVTAGGGISPAGRSNALSSIEEAKARAAEHDLYLVNATNIGTALTVINSHRSLIILCAIVGILPIILTLANNGGANIVSSEMVQQLQATNMLAVDNEIDTCEFLQDSVYSWMASSVGSRTIDSTSDVYVLSLQVLPVRCDWQRNNSFITTTACEDKNLEACEPTPTDDIAVFRGWEDWDCNHPTVNYACQVWGNTDNTTTTDELADRANIRPGVILTYSDSKNWFLTVDGDRTWTEFSVTAVYNEDRSVQNASFASFLLQITLLIFVLLGLSVLRLDASRLVLGPLRRMLKIVALYAKNPLAKAPRHSKRGNKSNDSSDSDGSLDSDTDSESDRSPDDQLGKLETEQLINAVEKITELLRKCWGVAGAGIISSNLARQEDGLAAVFNPCVPGKAVYALFAFAAIKGFDHQLRALGGEVMILINDVANVLHKEVYRWGFGDSGQCNKNLGSAFLMVFRIGDVKEVKEKRDRATDVIFASAVTEKGRGKRTTGTLRRRKYGANRSGSDASTTSSHASGIRVRKKPPKSAPSKHDLSLASLPGINAFTDRALIGILKTYAGIYRDQKLLRWKDDFRLGAGVGAFSVDMIFGMDAGWAVEGAVGSEYKIDATYLSPHVNMASRMMSACKQYGVNILLSQAVEELLSDQARSKLRHLDTVTVKGSSLKQRVFTYDARHKGVDFFLFERSEEQADLDSERYSPSLWSNDMDIKAMRQHVTDEFVDEFNRGRRAYLAGNWPEAVRHLQAADDIMVDTVMEQGYVEAELNEIRARILDGEDVQAEESHVRNEMGDGPSRCLMAFIERAGGVAPTNWKGFRPLTSK